MNYRLQILVPQYNETDEIVKPLLDSLETQKSIDFDWISVIICNDGSDTKLSQELLSKYPFNIRYEPCEHNGVSATRNKCLELSNAEYVMFCDADDKFICDDALFKIFRAIRENGDVVSFNFLKEIPDQDYELYEHDGTFVHGKVFKRNFLIENNLRFDERLSICEDSNFIGLCFSVAKSIKEVSDPIYMWTWREGSVSHSSVDYEYYCYLRFIESSKCLVDELIHRGLLKEAEKFVIQSIVYAYFTFYVTVFADTIEKEQFVEAENYFGSKFGEYADIWNNASTKKKIQIIDFIYHDVITAQYYNHELKLIEKWFSVLVMKGVS